MANYYCSSRTNYFRVKDRPAFDEWAAKYMLNIHDKADGSLCLTPGSYTDDGSFPSSYEDETGEHIQFEFPLELSRFLADGSIAVVIEVGNEKLRYLNGLAIAVDNTGQSVGVSLNEIYELAEENFGVDVTRAEY